MAPVPVPAPFNPIAPIQNNWDKISPWNSGYLAVLGGIGTIFGFAAAVSLIVEHKGKPPKWPFTKERWNPKPTIDGDKKEEVTEEQLEEDEMAEVVGTLGKRSFYDDELEWYDDDLLADAVSHLLKREDKDATVGEKLDELKEGGQEFAERAKEGAEKALQEGKTGLDKIGEEFGEIVETAEEVGKEIWEEIKDVFGGKKEGEQPAASGQGNETKAEGNATTRGDASRARRARFM